MKQHGPWWIRTSRQVYRDPFIDVRLDDVVRPDGNDGTHVVVIQKPGVSVLPISEHNEIFLTKEFHYGVGRVSLEVVSGGIDPGEQPAEAARRELREELGLQADDWQPLTTIDPFTTIVVSPAHLFIARNLSPAPMQPEGTELIEQVQMPLDQAVQQVFDGTITHAPTCVLLLMARLLTQ